MKKVNLSFSEALDYVKHGKRVAREGWSNKDAFITLTKGSFDQGRDAGKIGGIPTELFDLGDSGTVTRMPDICYTVPGVANYPGWTGWGADMLAEDWILLEE